jgi:hypothetical protein
MVPHGKGIGVPELNAALDRDRATMTRSQRMWLRLPARNERKVQETPIPPNKVARWKVCMQL